MPSCWAHWRAESSLTSAIIRSRADGMRVTRFSACRRPIRPAPIRPMLSVSVGIYGTFSFCGYVSAQRGENITRREGKYCQTDQQIRALQKRALLRAQLIPLRARLAHGRTIADLGDWHIPPALVARHAHQPIVLNVDHGRSIS